MSELGKPFLQNNQMNKIFLKKTESQCQNAAWEETTREMEIWFKQKTRTRKNYDLIGKTI